MGSLPFAHHVISGITRSSADGRNNQSTGTNWGARTVFAYPIFAGELSVHSIPTSRHCVLRRTCAPTPEDRRPSPPPFLTYPLPARQLRAFQRKKKTTMGFWDTITDLIEAAAPWATADAEAPAKEVR